jgi:large subunit ribosomal protein L23
MKIAKLGKERIYQVVRSPVVTEKSTLASEHNQITFLVEPNATKPEIAAAVQGLFDVKVKAVNTLRQDGKEKRFRGRRGRRAGFKKAMVTLEQGHSIDVASGV